MSAFHPKATLAECLLSTQSGYKLRQLEDTSAAVLCCFRFAVVTQPLARTKVRPISASPPISNQPQARGNPHEARVRANRDEIGPEKYVGLGKRQERRVVQESVDFVHTAETTQRAEDVVSGARIASPAGV